MVPTESWTVDVVTGDGVAFSHTLEMKGGQDIDWYKNRLLDVLDWRFGRKATYASFTMRRPDATPAGSDEGVAA